MMYTVEDISEVRTSQSSETFPMRGMPMKTWFVYIYKELHLFGVFQTYRTGAQTGLLAQVGVNDIPCIRLTRSTLAYSNEFSTFFHRETHKSDQTLLEA